MMNARLRCRRTAVALLLGAGTCLMTFGPGALRARAQAKEYPRVNLALSYRVDPDWPQRPEGVSWAAVSGVAVDGKDQVWLYTRGKPPVQVYTAGGKFVRAWGEDIIGTAHFLKLDHQGNVWVSDVGNHVVMQFTPEGKLLRTLGTRGEPGKDQTHLNKPTDMAVAPDGDVYVSDGYGNDRVVHFDKKGRFVKAWGKLGTGPGEFSLPHSIALDSGGRVYVADRNNARIQVFDAEGKFLAQWRNLLVPWGLCMTAKDELWACGCSPMTWPETGLVSCPPKDQVFMKFDTTGRLLQLWTLPKGQDGKEQPGEVNWLHAMALDSHGNIYAGDIRGQRAQKFVRHPRSTTGLGSVDLKAKVSLSPTEIKITNLDPFAWTDVKVGINASRGKGGFWARVNKDEEKYTEPGHYLALPYSRFQNSAGDTFDPSGGDMETVIIKAATSEGAGVCKFKQK